MVIAHVCLEHILQLAVGLLDLALILFELDVNFVHLVAHGVVLVEDLVQLLAQVAEELVEETGVVLQLLDVELVHDLGQGVEHDAGVVQLAHVHAVEDHVGALGDLVCGLRAEGNDGL